MTNRFKRKGFNNFITGISGLLKYMDEINGLIKV